MLQHWVNLTEWAQSIFRHADEKIPLLMHSPLPTSLETQETPFQSPSYVTTVDAIKASSGSSDYDMISRSKDEVTTFLIIVTLTS
jgi:hypothetical protein